MGRYHDLSRTFIPTSYSSKRVCTHCLGATVVIELVDFHKAYGSTIAVRELSFSVAPGQILGLVGPNGAGKTTTLRALTGMIPPSRGDLRVCGFNVCKSPLEAKRRLALVPDDPQLFRELTVEQHLAFTAGAYGIRNPDEAANQLLTQFDLIEKRHVAAGELSRGMRQKLAISCAYLINPEAVLFDEPLTGLDPRGIRILKQSIQARAEQGASIIISSHLLAMVEDICTHVLILNRGQQKFFGTIENLHREFGSDDQLCSLEDIFFAATDSEMLEAASAS